MTNLRLHFERMYEFAPLIVWDALIDADLVSGWLADALIDPRPGGEYTLRW
ncbi:MAG: SRPBCC domain-containing protein, partial [Salinibacterium sp.]|nr:SRPBCC domain-containing protein [Salinibacterium sp.]